MTTPPTPSTRTTLSDHAINTPSLISSHHHQPCLRLALGSRGPIGLEDTLVPEPLVTPRRPGNPDEELCALGTQGTDSADVRTPPELADPPCDHRTKTYAKIPVISPGSRGPVGADALPTPEPTVILRHREGTGRETDKGGNTYSSTDDEGMKVPQNIGTDKGSYAHSPKDFEGTKQSKTTRNTLFSVAGTSMPRTGGTPPPVLGVALSHSTASPSTIPEPIRDLLAPNAISFHPAVGTSLPGVGGTTPPASGGALFYSGHSDQLNPSHTVDDTLDISRVALSDADSTNETSDNTDEINASGRYDVRHSVNMSCESTDSTTAFPKPALPKPVNLLLQWNLNGFFQHLADLELLCHDSLPWVIALQEVNKVTVEQMDRSLGRKYAWTMQRGSNFRHSVAIGVLREIAFHPIDVASDLPFIAVQLEGPVNIAVACAYLPCGRLNGLNNRLKSAIDKLPEPRILVGDMNGHHPNWGCPRPNNRGSALADLFESEDLVVLNDGAPTFFNGRHATAIDVSTVSRDVAGKFQWTANSDLYGSDHYPIQIQLHAAAAPVTTRRPRWRYDKAEWEAYRNAIRSSINQQGPGNIPDLTKTILEAAAASIPKTSSIPGRKALRWWTEETKAAVKARRKALRKLRRTKPDDPGRDGILERYRGLHIQCRQAIRSAKQESWKNFLDSVDASQSSADLWSRVNALSGKRRSTPLQVQSEGGTISEPVAVADELGKYFAELSAIPGYNENFRRRNNATPASIGNFHVPADNDSARINGVFSWEELQFALNKSKGKSAGPDELGYPLLTHLPIEGQVRMLELFNELWTTDSYPASWRESLVIPIPKTNETTKDATKFRPIALTSCMSKVFERMVNRRLKTFLETNNLLDHRQHAFRQGCGTSTYFTTLGDVLKDAFDQGHHTEIVSLDISKAFNRTWTPAVLTQLVRWGLKGHMVHFVRNFLTDRSFRVAIGNAKSSSFREETGVPQGSVISVTLFLIAMNGVFSRLPKNVHIFVYADDVLIVVTGPTTIRTRNIAQAAVTAVVKWAETAGFQLSARKSVRCHVCPSRHRVSGAAIKIVDQAIPVRNSVRILGVLVDRTLSFVPHFHQVKKDCRSRVNLVRTISRPHRSNNRAVRFRVAQAIIDSRLLYGTELTCIASEKQMEILGPTFNSSIRIISGLLPSTPADSACIEAGVLPFRYRIINAILYKAASYAAKTAGNGRVFLLDEGDRIMQSIASIDLPPVARIHWHGEKSWLSSKLKIENGIKNRFKAGDNSVALRHTVAELIRTKYAEFTHRYTDGSRSNTGVGIGVSGSGILASNSLPPQCSVYSAEAAAIFHAATSPANLPILLLTDSYSAIQELCSATPTHPWIQATVKYAPSSTVFAWIPGHCGIPGNEAADQLAGTGPSGPRFTDKVPLQDVRRWIKATVWKAWTDQWANTRGPFIRKIKGTTEAWTDLRNLPDQRVLSRLRTGHCRLYLNFGGGPFRRSCTICHVPATVEHLLCVCPEFQDLRETYGITSSIRNLLGEDSPAADALLVFLREANLYHQI